MDLTKLDALFNVGRLDPFSYKRCWAILRCAYKKADNDRARAILDAYKVLTGSLGGNGKYGINITWSQPKLLLLSMPTVDTGIPLLHQNNTIPRPTSSHLLDEINKLVEIEKERLKQQERERAAPTWTFSADYGSASTSTSTASYYAPFYVRTTGT